tara:strand:- start:1122 stop:1592 length:471 start_codon:yes stop_codon:yes gene_type:complete
MKNTTYLQAQVNVIVTFMEEEQLWYNTKVIVDWELYPLNREFFALDQVVDDLVNRTVEGKRDISRLVKISLCYTVPDSDWIGTKGEADRVPIARWDFIKRANAQYYFQPDQRDLMSDLIVERYWDDNVAVKTIPHSEQFPEKGKNKKSKNKEVLTK